METLIWMFIAGVLVFAGLMVSRENIRLGGCLIVAGIVYAGSILLIPRLMDL